MSKIRFSQLNDDPTIETLLDIKIGIDIDDIAEQLFRRLTTSNKLEIAPVSTVQTPQSTEMNSDKINKLQDEELRTAATTNRDDLTYEGPEIWKKLVRNWPIISQPLAVFIICIVLWATFFSILPQYTKWDSTIMRIAYLFIGAQLSGILVSFIHLPDMLGMLFWGVLYTNIGLADFSGYGGLEVVLREMALINIMLLAGFGLEYNAFKKVWLMVTQLTLIPTMIEVLVITVLAKVLIDMPWIWGVLLGLVITAVSPNVVVTVMLKLKEDRLGLNGGIHTIIYAMTACNDVVAIFLFGVLNGVIFSTGSLSEQLLQGPVGIGIGIVFGYLYGIMIIILPSNNSKYANGLRFVMTVLGGAVSVKGSQAIRYPSAGALGCVVIAFVVSTKWKSEEFKKNNKGAGFQVSERLDLLWKFLKPVSFSLIGKECNFAILDGKIIGLGVVIIIVGCVFRLVASFLSTYGGKLTWKERAYITISGFPKATVQAALGPIALDTARLLGRPEEDIALASNVLIISVLAIIMTAPLGAILMLRLAPKWLKWSPPIPRNSISNDPTLNDGNSGTGNGTIDSIVISTNLNQQQQPQQQTNLNSQQQQQQQQQQQPQEYNANGEVTTINNTLNRKISPSSQKSL